MMQKAIRRSMALLLVLTFVLALGGVQAFAETATDTLTVFANENTGNTSATYDSIAVAEVETNSPHMPVAVVLATDGASAELIVTGDVSGAANTGTTLGTNGVVADAAAAQSSASAEIGGDVTIQSADGSGGVTAQAGSRLPDAQNPNLQGADAQVTVDGDVSVTVSGSGENAHAVGADAHATNGGNASVSVGGDITAESG